MRPLPLLSLLLLLPACASLSPQRAVAPAKGAPAPDARKQDTDLLGVLVPADATGLSLWPSAWKGELVVLEVAQDGARVEQGEVVLKLDARALSEELERARLELESARVRHEALLARHALEADAAQAELVRSRAALDRSRRSLASWSDTELALEDRTLALQEARERARVEDQVDELDQLQKMYEHDELVDATEGIVLKRAQRELALTNDQGAIARDQRAVRTGLQRQLEREGRVEAVVREEQALARLEATQAIDARTREDAARRSAAELGEKERQHERLAADLELCELRAPRSGVLLHGRVEEWRPGKTPQRLARGKGVPSRTEVLLVADPRSLAVAVDLPEARARQGQAARVHPLGAPDRTLSGRVVLPALPVVGAGDGGRYEARIELDEPAEGLVLGGHARVELVDEER